MNHVVRRLALTMAMVLTASAAFPGNLVFEPVTEAEVVEQEPMGGSNAGIIVPLVALGIVALGIALSSGDDDDGGGGGGTGGTATAPPSS